MNPMSETKKTYMKKTTHRRETPPDFSQFKGKRLDKEPSQFLEMVKHALWFFAGAGILLAMIFSLFYFV
ncbi:hypothetical protein [Planococcus halocryophilus]|uniref:Uncharacterized protein n=2 Tax=Planococcus halocryophilus TaxID=1215089 RepID=A0A1C7DPV1_9BACL|nr:hypothetical protein [Planococcus halocryophilus]ANU13243.1 hypothetical protein BBI08_05035 [Planococcus halocryophilus]